MSDKLKTPEFRVSFPNVFKARAFKDQEPKFSCVMIFSKSAIAADPEQAKLFRDLKDAVAKCGDDKWPNKKPSNLRDPFRKGTEKEEYEGYDDDKIFITASTKQRPGVVDENVKAIIEEGEFYAGCYARATVNTFAYDAAGNKGVSFGLQNIQKIRDGEPLSGRSKPSEDFDAVSKQAAEEADNTDALFD